MTILHELGVDVPLAVAPMAGGPGSPELVIAAAAAGALGVVAGGYRTPDALAGQIAQVRAATGVFGVNLFAPNPVPVDPAAYARYRTALLPDAERFGVELSANPVEDDDAWAEKIALLTADPVPLVSFTFGIPAAADLAALRRAGSVLVQTVTTVDEAGAAAAAGVDALAVQGSAAGGHSGTLTPSRLPAERALPDLVAEIVSVVGLPVIAAGGLSDAAAVTAAIDAGAEAVMAGTAFLLAPEAGTSEVHRLALAGPDRGPTLLTRAFTGRPARAVPNRFTTAHDAAAPAGYPALHHLTSPLRRASAAARDPEQVNLWAGTGYREIRDRPAAETVSALVAGL